MYYVQRNDDGLIVGLFANLQKGFAEEQLSEDHHDVKEFYARLNAEFAKGSQ